MCGFAGFLGGILTSGAAGGEVVLARMGTSLAHRGPDDAGIWCDVERRIGLSHRRLSIVDLSPAGHQPMTSHSARYVMAFNGEIYNHMDLRAALQHPTRVTESPVQAKPSIVWRGHSDTETLLAGFDAWGIQDTIERSLGMFALAVWDRETSLLTLVRDRVGEKPLYYGWQGDTFLFGSELKALRAHPSFNAAIDRGALALMMRHSYIPTPYSIYEGIAKLQPGCLLTVSLQERVPKITPYWSVTQAIEIAQSNAFLGSAAQAVDELQGLLTDAVRRQLMSDVPLGAFLSGGVDSSVIVALAQSQSSSAVKTFTIGFHESGYNEAAYAKAVARHIGTDHTELYVTPNEAMAVIPRLPELYDEPFSDSSQIPTFLVSQLARERVTVSLSGDGGDELFGGYNRYQFADRLWNGLKLIPTPIRGLVAKALTNVSPATWTQMDSQFGKFFPQQVRVSNLSDKLHKAASVLRHQTSDALYLGLVSHWTDPASLVVGGLEPPTLLNGLAPDLRGLSTVERMMALDTMTYLPDDILVKVDRAAMGVSLESRVPFLDHRVVEFSWRLPQSMKLNNGQTKWALRQLLYRHVPKKLIDRPKMGFGVPIGDWLRGPLRGWAEALLASPRLDREGFFHSAPIRQRWEEHLSGQRNWQYALWNVLMFQAWLEAQETSS